MQYQGMFRRRLPPQFGVATPGSDGVANSEDVVVSVPDYTSQAGAPQPAATSLLPDLSGYTHTVPEASCLMQESGCRYHSERKVQRLCAGGKIDCYRLQTTRSGQPVTEWLVNGSALLVHIRKFEPMRDDNPDVATPEAAPSDPGAASEPVSDPRSRSMGPADSKELSDPVASPPRVGAANEDGNIGGMSETKPDVTVPPSSFGDAIGVRELSQSPDVLMLIEKAELRAQLEAQKEVITELREDKRHYRQLLTDERVFNRELQREVKAMGDKALDTIQNIALRGVLTGPKKQPEEHGSDDGREGDNPPSMTSTFGV